MAQLVSSSGVGNENSILAMQRGFFNYKRELKALFSKALGGVRESEDAKDRDGAQGGNVR